VVLNLHLLADGVRAMFASGTIPAIPEVRFTMEETILGTAGGIGRAAPLLRGAGPILLHNCDFLSDIDFGAAVEAHRASGMAATLVVVPTRPGYSVIETDSTGRVLSLAGQPSADASRVARRSLFTGCHILDEEVLAMIPANRASGLVEEIFRPLATEGRLGSYLHPGFWWEFGTPELYLEGSLRLLDMTEHQRIEITSHDPVNRIDGGRIAVGPGATLDADLQLAGRVAIGMASRLGSGSRVRDSVVMRESWIGPRSRLDRVVVGPGVEIPGGYQGRDCLVCSVAAASVKTIPADLRRDGDLVIYDFATERVAE
jgi:mannose-1-phosphate guanylyltransferase